MFSFNRQFQQSTGPLPRNSQISRGTLHLWQNCRYWRMDFSSFLFKGAPTYFLILIGPLLSSYLSNYKRKFQKVCHQTGLFLKYLQPKTIWMSYFNLFQQLSFSIAAPLPLIRLFVFESKCLLLILYNSLNIEMSSNFVVYYSFSGGENHMKDGKRYMNTEIRS